jgi:phosphate transport system substrate-binding protein
VKILAVSRKAGSPGILPSDKTIEDETYPLFRYLLAYTMGKPSGAASEFLNYCTSNEGQAMVLESGYLPL